jgi:hypothetical protein
LLLLLLLMLLNTQFWSLLLMPHELPHSSTPDSYALYSHIRQLSSTAVTTVAATAAAALSASTM